MRPSRRLRSLSDKCKQPRLHWISYDSSHHCQFASPKSEEPLPSKPTSRACRSRRSSLPTTTIRAFFTPRTRLCSMTSPRFCTQRSRSRNSQHRFCSTPSIGFRRRSITSPDCFRTSCSQCPVLQKTYLAMHRPSARCYGLP